MNPVESVRMAGDQGSIDVSALPETTFGHRAVTWWGTLGFMAAEGTTLVVCAVAYLYLQRNFQTWPPAGVPLPSLTIPTIQAALMLLSIPVVMATSRAARRLDLDRVRIGMVLATVFALVFCVLRWFEFRALHTRWDTNAYGSAAWAIVFAHATLLVAQLAEGAAITALLYLGPVEPKHIADVDDSCLYWYFMTGAWIVLYLLVFVSPRLQA
jgi:heme/copper-type cytochrome/quinol oxidase subunit 3